MAWKKESAAAFTGGSGQAAVLAELLHRQCNAAVPHIDVGMDVFAFRDDREDVARIQVKTAPGKPYKNGPGYSAKFGVPIDQLRRYDSPPLFYALAARLPSGWADFVVISRAALQELWNQGCGSENTRSGDLELHIQFRPLAEITEGSEDADKRLQSKAARGALCGAFDFSSYVNAWNQLPPLKSLGSLSPEPNHAAARSPGGK